MKMSITADQIGLVVKSCYHAGIAPLFIGKPGIGKTEIVTTAVKELAAELDEHVHIRFLHAAGMAETDVRGYLIPVDSAVPPLPGREATSTKYAAFTKPEFWADVEKYPRGILFLDELLQANPEVQKALAPLILEGRIGEYILPPGWRVVAAGNGIEDGAGAGAMLTHVTNRVCVVNVVSPEVSAWAAWAAENHVPFELIAFAQLRPTLVFNTDVPDEPNAPYCTARSLTRLGDLSKHYPGGLRRMVEEPVGRAMVAGMVGDGAAAELSAVVRVAINLPSFEQVVANPTGTPVPTELDKVYSMVIMVAMRADASNADAVMTYLSRFDANHALTGVIAMVRRDVTLLQNAQMSTWIMGNRGILDRFQKHIAAAIQR